MDMKTVAIAAAVMVVAAGVSAALIINNDDGQGRIADRTNRMSVLGNLYADDVIDSMDREHLEKKVADPSYVFDANGDGVTDDSDKEFIDTYSDVNNDGRIDRADLEYLDTIIDRTATKLFYVNSSDKVAEVTVPIDKIAVAFRRTAETISLLGVADAIVGVDSTCFRDYKWINLPGNVRDLGNSPAEAIKALDEEIDGRITVFCDSTGAPQESELEGKLVDSQGNTVIDVVRLPVTEYGLSPRGVVTTAFILGFTEEYRGRVQANLEKWTVWHDTAAAKIADSVSRLEEGDRKTCLIGNYIASQGSINLRKSGSTEWETTNRCGGNNVYTSSLSTDWSAEILKELNPDVMIAMLQTTSYYQGNVDTQDALDKLKTTYKEYVGQGGRMTVILQEVCTGAGYVISMMYYASMFCGDLAGQWEIQKEYEWYMKEFFGVKEGYRKVCV